MDHKEFVSIRKNLGKTQKQLSELLGTSLKAVHSYEQGWRNIPIHVERQLLFLFFKIQENDLKPNPCWKVKNCPLERKNKCPSWEFQSGKLCWFITGTICSGSVHKDWKEKMRICRDCEVFMPILAQM